MVEFSLVCPIRDEVDLIPRTLPSFYAVSPSEVVLCFDDPPNSQALEIAKKIARACNAEKITKFIFVRRDPKWAYHQANVRRSGFIFAKYDIILTTDIDLILNDNVLKAVDRVGKNDVGLCSCGKFYYPHSLVGLIRTISYNIIRRIYVYMKKLQTGLSYTTFTGLYALYRPYWLDSEDPEEVRKLSSLKSTDLSNTQSTPIIPMGEDTFLRDSMVKKHYVIYLPDIGGINITRRMHDRPKSQFENGRYSFDHGGSLLEAMIHTLWYIHPHFLRGYIYEKLRTKKKMRFFRGKSAFPRHWNRRLEV